MEGSSYNLEDLVLDRILAERATTHRNDVFLKFREGECTFGEVEREANRVANGFASLGVSEGDHVALMLPNSPEFVHVIFALAKLGAVAVPINTAYKGELLRHVLETSDATTFVVDELYVDRVPAVVVDLSRLSRIVVRSDGHVPGAVGKPTVSYRTLRDHGDDVVMSDASFADLQAIMYTSGTTGRSKGVMSPHGLALTCALDSLEYLNGWEKTYYCPLPLFHAAGLWDGLGSAVLSGSPIAVVDRFSASGFWDDVRDFGANVALGVFSMIPILLSKEPTPRDRDHSLESFYMGKSALDEAFYERFGVHTVETYTSTEAGIPIGSPYGEWRTGSCGVENSERFEVKVVDELDREVPPGEPGELVIRPKQPFVLTTGYYGYWEHTTHIFRNQWFHTGDRMYRDPDGYFYFLDRMKDAIRRRGENISAFDVECEINLHPDVHECAAIGVPSDLEEEEMKVVAVRRPGSDLRPEELAAYCAEQLPAFMVPRYIEFVDELPRTATDKIAKHKLRTVGDQGITPATWDCEAAAPVSEPEEAPPADALLDERTPVHGSRFERPKRGMNA